MNRDNQQRLRQLTEENNSLTRRLSEYEFQITNLSQEIQRLNGILKVKVDEISQLQQKNTNLSMEFDETRRRYSDLELKYNQMNR